MKDIKSIVIAALLVIAGSGIAYFLFSSGGGGKESDTEKVAKRVKIEIPEEGKKEESKKPDEKAEPPKEAEKPLGQPAPQPVKEEAKALIKQAEVKPSEKKPEKTVEPKPVKEEKAKEEVKPKEPPKPEKKEVAKVEPKPEPKKEAAKKEMKNAKGLSAPSWAVHVASYVTRDEAAAMQKKLKEDGYNAYITDFNLKGRQWYRLRVGFYAAEDAAKAVSKKIAKAYSLAGVWTVKPTKKEISAHN